MFRYRESGGNDRSTDRIAMTFVEPELVLVLERLGEAAIREARELRGEAVSKSYQRRLPPAAVLSYISSNAVGTLCCGARNGGAERPQHFTARRVYGRRRQIAVRALPNVPDQLLFH